jgi:hypothetical protein
LFHKQASTCTNPEVYEFAKMYEAWMNGYELSKESKPSIDEYATALKVNDPDGAVDAAPGGRNKGDVILRNADFIHKGVSRAQRQDMIHMCMDYMRTRNRQKYTVPLYMSVDTLAKTLVDTLQGLSEEERAIKETKIAEAIYEDDAFVLAVSADILNRQADIVPSHHREALALDAYYAKLVKGAAVNVAMKLVWVPDDEDEHSRLDKDAYQKIMWDVMNSVFNGVSKDEAMVLKGDVVYNTAIQMREIKRALTDVWEEAKNFRISNEVHMTEISVLERLCRDGVFHWLHARNVQEHRMRVCFMMRRSPSLRYAFASVVGKRFLSERIISANRVQIIEHHRTVSWAEREYMALVELLRRNAGQVKILCRVERLQATSSTKASLATPKP